MRLEAEAGTAFRATENEPDPFDLPTGYHKIAVEVMSGLVSDQPRSVVVNVRNENSIEDLSSDDVVEVPCAISREGVKPMPCGRLPESVRGLVLAVKAYERTVNPCSHREIVAGGAVGHARIPNYRSVGDCPESSQGLGRVRSRASWIFEKLALLGR